MAKEEKRAKKKKPSSSDNSGRDDGGRFTKGNRNSVGNIGKSSEHARELKQALLKAVTEDDIKEIAKKLIISAKGGDTPATKELFDRIWGRAKQEIDLGEGTVSSLVDILARMCGDG